jgi:hypothetical protein
LPAPEQGPKGQWLNKMPLPDEGAMAGEKEVNPASRIGRLLICLLVVGCSSHYPAARPVDVPGGVIYRISEPEALNLARTTLAAMLPEVKIYPTQGARRGFYATEEKVHGQPNYSRFLVETYTHHVFVMPAQGLDPAGRKVTGYYVEVSGSGVLASGPPHNDQLKAGLRQAFEKTGQGVAVSAVESASYANVAPEPQASVPPDVPTAPGQDVFEQLKKLKELRDQDVITEEEFQEKKKLLLDRI